MYGAQCCEGIPWVHFKVKFKVLTLTLRAVNSLEFEGSTFEVDLLIEGLAPPHLKLIISNNFESLTYLEERYNHRKID